MENERRTLSVKEAAKELGIGKNLCYQLCKRGQMPGMIRLGEKRIVISRIQIERLLEEKKCEQQ